MRKHMVYGVVLGLSLLMPAAARAQFTMIQPVNYTGPFSHPGFDQGGWFAGADLLFLQKVFGTYNGLAPDSILSVGYRTEDNIVYEIRWWDQWFSDVLFPTEKLQIIDFAVRFETYNNGCFRQYGIIGPRGILEDQIFAFGGGRTYAVANNMVGGYIGCMNEWYLGTNPIGAWSFTLDGDIGAYANFIRQTAGSPGGAVGVSSFTLSGSLEGKAGFIWYVWEGITIHFGLEALTIINLEQNTNATVTGNTINGTLLRSTMPVWLGGYVSFGFVF